MTTITCDRCDKKLASRDDVYLVDSPLARVKAGPLHLELCKACAEEYHNWLERWATWPPGTKMQDFRMPPIPGDMGRA